jgi:hypothetical protein
LQDWRHIALGFSASVIGGEVVLYLLLEKFLWPRAAKRHKFTLSPVHHLSGAVGMVERFLYTSALIVGVKEWVGVWLAVKVIARWQSAAPDKQPEDSNNIWLIGTGLSLWFGFLGACIVLGHAPTFLKD